MLFYKEMFIPSFDEVYRYRHSKMDTILIYYYCGYGNLSASMRVVGILLVSALITLPIAISMRITKLNNYIISSIILGELSVVLGLALALYEHFSWRCYRCFISDNARISYATTKSKF